MIDAGPLTQEDADEYRIEITDTAHIPWAIVGTADDDQDLGPDQEAFLRTVRLTMTNHDALELAASLLVGAVFLASDSSERRRAWEMLLAQRIIAARGKEKT